MCVATTLGKRKEGAKPVNNDVVGQSVAHRCAPRISENAGKAGKVESGGGKEREGGRKVGEQFVWIREMQVRLTLRRGVSGNYYAVNVRALHRSSARLVTKLNVKREIFFLSRQLKSIVFEDYRYGDINSVVIIWFVRKTFSIFN